MKQKKVLFLITKATWGGAQKYVYDLATGLPQEFEVVVAFGTHGKLADKLASAQIRTQHLPSLDRDIAILSDIRGFFEIVRTIRSERPNIVHLNSSKAAALGALAARILFVPRVIFTVHGWPFKEDRDTVLKIVIRFVSWITSVMSHMVIVVSREDEFLGKQMAFLEHKIRYVPIGISAIEFFSRDDAANSLSVKEVSTRVVTIAELTANKGLSYALRAFALLKERGEVIHYYIVGEGEERSRLEQTVRSLHIEDRVHFLGFIPDAAKYLKAFDVFLLPSVKEGMPYVLLEATLAGLAIITTTVVDPEFFRRNPSARAVEAANPTACADALYQSMHTQPNPQESPPLGRMIADPAALYRATQEA